MDSWKEYFASPFLMGIIIFGFLASGVELYFSEEGEKTEQKQHIAPLDIKTPTKWDKCIEQGLVATESLINLWPQLDITSSVEGCGVININNKEAWGCHYKIPLQVDKHDCRAISYTDNCYNWRTMCSCHKKGQENCGYSPKTDI